MKPQKPNFLTYLLPRLQDVLFISIFVSVISLGPRMFNVDGDLGRHITIGEYILDTGDIPTSDIFSHTMAGEPLTPHEWASQVIFGLLHRVAGLDGIVWFCSILIAATFTLVYKQAVRQSGLILISLVMATLAAASSSLHWLTRPHLFTMLFIIIWVIGLERMRWGRSIGWWYFPGLMLLWVNLHGAFIAGFVIWGVYLVGEITDDVFKLGRNAESPSVPPFSRVDLVKNYLVIGGLSCLVTLINPSGWHVWKTSVGYLGNRYLVSHTAEYLPPNFHDPSTWPFLVMIITSLVILGLNRQRISAISLLMLVGWTAMSLYSVRNVPLYAILVAPILTEIAAREINTAHILVSFTALQMRLSKVEASLRGFFWPLFIVLLFSFTAYHGFDLDFEQRGNHYYKEVFPVDAVDWLEENQQSGPMFNYFPWGGYLLYRLWPSEHVFIDGQTDFYGETLTREYEQVITITGDWESILDKYQVSWVLMPSESVLVRELRSTTAWLEVYTDSFASILVRSP